MAVEDLPDSFAHAAPASELRHTSMTNTEKLKSIFATLGVIVIYIISGEIFRNSDGPGPHEFS